MLSEVLGIVSKKDEIPKENFLTDFVFFEEKNINCKLLNIKFISNTLIEHKSGILLGPKLISIIF